MASGFPVIYVDMIYTLNKDNHGRSSRGWQISGYTLLAERYDFEEYVDPGSAGAWGPDRLLRHYEWSSHRFKL
ncbi:MAG: hypothetical protein K6U03_03275 [Firmicutes bacterium]|nr:hypothetical protein [Bacillota bacterium]